MNRKILERAASQNNLTHDKFWTINAISTEGYILADFDADKNTEAITA